MGLFGKSTNKNNSNTTEAAPDKWRDKYLDLLDTQEQSEKERKFEQELLCKAIVRLSVAASGFDNQLDPYLLRIRSHLKSGINSVQLKAELEQFTDVLTRITDASEQRPAATTSVAQTDESASRRDIDLLFEFLLHHYQEPQQNSALVSIRDSLTYPLNTQQLFLSIAEIIERKPERIKQTNSELPFIIASPAVNEPAINKHLISLIERLDIPEALTAKAQALKQQLNSAQNNKLDDHLDNVINFLLEINAANLPKQQEIDKFLAIITEQLAELDKAVTGSTMAVIDASVNRSKLDQSVSEQMNELHTRSLAATQLEPLKAVISSKISQITKEIHEHKTKEQAQREQTQKQLDELSQKIKSMESETSDLKSKLQTASTHAMRDPLTDLPNRFAYDERLTIEITRWQRYHTPLSLIVWDIDFFKKVNDQYGHQAGDKVLIHVAKQFTENARKADFTARFGGEEFTMLLPHTNKQSAFKLAHKLRYLIEQSRININGELLAVTVSCGITQFIDGDTHEAAFARADQALYRAKEQGRNQCCLG
ncbi:GGDEF domain-containing protein [Methylocucumis oryzae]|uniref:diguanylate cyclase n=1 Tax=Methylocucumis oryzae TaxID=1632867 RepID=A0A0F3IJW3_9GAMM|nr:GGDEF domain-containing protein [Methylocucumis oryzae]KJV05849.1 hypothetical protein VZ94_15180 [Methylocucumis oryzae]